MREVNLPIEVQTKVLDFESFFRAEYRSLSQALLLLVGDAFEAEEIAQETMTRVLERWDRVGTMDSPAGYAYRTALNLQRKRILVDWLGMDAQEAADVLGIKPANVRVRLHRARSSLRDALEVRP